ncbi:site-specific integrase [Actinomadura rubrisoli]|uniref:Site-specific integrase n=1 Tax=Actinomadura rubrisoli TaxID=2530368 RepID=A0A4R5CFC7_9ACTN|nr:site-specific integrase [Actinomadura rubrisoli]TDD97666.1 site-specific integrase [Actinomadura rubrisoli]
MSDLEVTSSPIVVRPTEPPPVAYSDIDFTISADTAERLINSTAENTRIAYDRAWKDFREWCEHEGRVYLPATAQTLTEYVNHMCRGKSAPNTIAQAISTIRSKHTDAGCQDEPDSEKPLKALKTYRRQWAEDGNREKQATPIMPDALRAMIATCDLRTLQGVRDRALLLLGFNMMARRSELVGLDQDDAIETPEGLSVYVKRSKTDQEASGIRVAIPRSKRADMCPVEAVNGWKECLAERGLVDGPLFRPVDRHGRIGGEPNSAGKVAVRLTGKSACDIVHRRGVLANLPAKYTSHGLRAGSASTAYAAGVPISEIAKHGRWNPNSPVLLVYIRAVDQWRNNPMNDIEF